MKVFSTKVSRITHMLTHTHLHIHHTSPTSHTHTHTHTHTHACTHISHLTHTHTHAHTHISHLPHTHTHAHTHISHLTHTHTHTHAHTHISHLTHPHVHVPEDIFLILCFPCSLEGGVLGPHWKRDPCVVQYLSAELCPPRALGLDVGLGQCTVASTMALQTVEIWSETTAGLNLQQPACS